MEHRSTVSQIISLQMTRILHLALLLLPTVLSFQFDRNHCFEEEFVCIIQDKCKREGRGDFMRITEKVDNNYDQSEPKCDVHVMIRQYTTSSYLIRIVGKKSTEIKLKQDQRYFGCILKNGKLDVTPSGKDINMKLISPEKYTGEGMVCEFTVTYTNGDEVFPDGKEMHIERNDDTAITIEDDIPKKIKKKLQSSLYKCNPNSIQMDHDGLNDQEYSIQPINANFKTGKCEVPYKMAFVDLEGKVEEGKQMDCEMDVKDDCEKSNPQTCEWKYHIAREGRKKKFVAPAELKAACRQKVCKMCEDVSSSCDGPTCKPKFDDKADCNTLQCSTLFEGKSIVEMDGGNRTFGTFECVLEKENGNKAIWKLNKKSFKQAICFDTIECDDNNPLNFKCADEKKKEGCPAVDSKEHLVKCPPGYDLEVIVGGKTIEPKKVQCDKKKGYYHYRMDNDSSPIDMEKEEDRTVMCARQDSVKAATGFRMWQLLLIVLGVLILVALLILCIFCVRRSKKKEEEKKALLKRNDSAAPSSTTESGKPQINRNLVHMQPCSTAKQISSEQISEATAIERTKKEYAEKTMIEPTLDLATAYSQDKSRQSKRESGSIEAEIIDDGKRSRSQRSEKNSGPDREESAPSAKATLTSKKDSGTGKESGKTDNIKPKKFELNEKEKKIAQGVWRRNEDYPTMADIESDWDDAKDGKPPSKQRTATKDIPTADTPSARVAKIPDLNEKTAEMERLIAQPLSPLKQHRVTASEDLLPPKSRESDSRVSVRRNNNKIAKLMTTLDATQEQK